MQQVKLIPEHDSATKDTDKYIIVERFMEFIQHMIRILTNNKTEDIGDLVTAAAKDVTNHCD